MAKDSFVVEVTFNWVFNELQAYQLSCLLFKIPKNSWDNVFRGVPFYRGSRQQILHRVTALKNFFENSKEGLQM